MRCPKCQNNSIADSNSMIATDLRQKVTELMQEGKSKKEIVDYMVARYGNFVTYDSAVNAADGAVWVLRAVAIGIGGWVIYARSRPRVRVVPEAFPEQSVQEGKRARIYCLSAGYCGGVNCGWRQLHQTGNYQQVKIWRQRRPARRCWTGRWIRADPAQRRRCASCAGDAYSTAKKSGRYRRLDYVGPRLAWRWVMPVSPPMHTPLRIASIAKTVMPHSGCAPAFDTFIYSQRQPPRRRTAAPVGENGP
ncbi:cytochrome c-type biogenesis protein [Shigella flexneri]